MQPAQEPLPSCSHHCRPLALPSFPARLCPSSNTLTAYEEAMREAEADAQDPLEES